MVLSALFLSLALAAPPVVPNAGFEEGADAPAGWTYAAGENGRAEFTWDSDLAHSGQRSFRVRFHSAHGHARLTAPLVAVEPGHRYTVSAWVYPVRPVRRGVYFMISQLPADRDEWDLPNTFGDTSRALAAGEWQRLELQVTVREGNTRLQIHGIQAFAPSEVCWDDFAVTEAQAADEQAKPRYEPPPKEELPDLGRAREIVARRPRAAVTVEQRGGRPRLSLDGRPTPWAWYVSPFWNPNDAQIADFRDAGVRVYLVPLVLGWQVYADRGPWRGPNTYDFSEVDDLLWRVLRVDPEGYILFYMACDPYRDWGRDNPDHVTCDQNGVKSIAQMHPKRWGDDPQPPERFAPSLVSHKLRADVSECLRRLAAHIEQSEPGKAVIGYHVAGMNDGQWFQWVSFDPKNLHLADWCPGAQASYRDWLRARYGTEESLRRAWGRDEVTFEQVGVPPFERLWTDRALLDPATDQDLADYTRFYSEGVAETVIELATVLKQATPRRILCGTYYEDITCNSANHIALGRLLESDAIDFLAGPAAYGIRMPGYQGAIRSVFGSTLLHGKTYLTEQDWRSFRSAPNLPEQNSAWGRAETAAAHNAMVRRECGMMLAFGTGTWWYDMSGGWFRDDGIMAGIAEACRAFSDDLAIDDPPRGDLAVVVSEDSNHYFGFQHGGAYRYTGVLQQIQELNLAGVPYRLYLQSDLGPGLPDHRAWLFLNAYRLSDSERRFIEALKSDGRLLIFIHAPGAVGSANPAETIGALTGIAVRAADGVHRLQTEGEISDDPLLRGLDGVATLPCSLVGPAFEVTDPDARPLTRYLETGAVAGAARDHGAWKSVFLGAPGVSAELLHRLANWAGCWVAADPGDAVYANEHFITIHALYSGHKVLRLARPARVIDLISREPVAERAETIELDMARGETRWFRLRIP